MSDDIKTYMLPGTSHKMAIDSAGNHIYISHMLDFHCNHKDHMRYFSVVGVGKTLLYKHYGEVVNPYNTII